MWLTIKKTRMFGDRCTLNAPNCELIIFSCIRTRRPIIVDILEGVGQSIFSGVEFMFNNIWKKKIPSRLDNKDIYIYTSLCTWCHVTNLNIDIDWPSFMKYSCITLQAFIHCSAMPFGDTCAYVYLHIYTYYIFINWIYLCCGLKWVSQHCPTYITNRDWLMWWHQFVFLQDKTIAIYLMVVPIYSMQWWRHERDAPIATMMSHSRCDEPLWPMSLSPISPIVTYCWCGHHGVMTHSPVCDVSWVEGDIGDIQS